MKKDDCYQLGEVIKTHGLTGEVYISLDVDFPEAYTELESVFLEQNGKLIPFFIESIKLNGKRALVRFEDVTSIDEATLLVKSELYLPLTLLPKLEGNSYYYHDLNGCEVLENEKSLGTVKEVIDLSSNILLSVISGSTEILIPLKDEIIKKVDLKKKRIEVDLPDGLLDLYTS